MQQPFVHILNPTECYLMQDVCSCQAKMSHPSQKKKQNPKTLKPIMRCEW